MWRREAFKRLAALPAGAFLAFLRADALQKPPDAVPTLPTLTPQEIRKGIELAVDKAMWWENPRPFFEPGCFLQELHSQRVQSITNEIMKLFEAPKA